MNQPSPMDIDLPPKDGNAVVIDNGVAETKVVAIQSATPAPANDAASLMQVITRAASDPAVDIDKLERLMAMWERIEAANQRRAYNHALSVAQQAIPVIERKGKISFTDKTGNVRNTPYALWEDVNEAIKPILAANGLALSFKTDLTAAGLIQVTAILKHEAGHEENTSMTLKHDSSGSKNDVQAIGSSISYGKRYTAMAILNITSRGEDDDGNKASGDESETASDTISEQQLDNIRHLIVRANVDVKKFCAYLSKHARVEIGQPEDIPSRILPYAVKALEDRIRATNILRSHP